MNDLAMGLNREKDGIRVDVHGGDMYYALARVPKCYRRRVCRTQYALSWISCVSYLVLVVLIIFTALIMVTYPRYRRLSSLCSPVLIIVASPHYRHRPHYRRLSSLSSPVLIIVSMFQFCCPQACS